MEKSIKHKDPLGYGTIKVRSVTYPTVSLLKGGVYHRNNTILKQERRPIGKNGWRG